MDKGLRNKMLLVKKCDFSSGKRLAGASVAKEGTFLFFGYLPFK